MKKKLQSQKNAKQYFFENVLDYERFIPRKNSLRITMLKIKVYLLMYTFKMVS